MAFSQALGFGGAEESKPFGMSRRVQNHLHRCLSLDDAILNDFHRFCSKVVWNVSVWLRPIA